MKKLFVIAALVMLVPFAYAEEANASASVSAEASAESSAADVQVGITSSGQGGNKYRDRVLKESRDRAKAREDVVARVAVKKEVVKAVKNETNEVRKEVKEAVKETRAQMKDAVKELKECKNKRTKDCEAKRVEGRLDARQSILKSADATLQLLTAAKARASAVSVDAGLD
jgi:gas vesicle protein